MSILPSRTNHRRPSARFNTRVDRGHQAVPPEPPAPAAPLGLVDAYDPPPTVETLVAELPPAPLDFPAVMNGYDVTMRACPPGSPPSADQPETIVPGPDGWRLEMVRRGRNAESARQVEEWLARDGYRLTDDERVIEKINPDPPKPENDPRAVAIVEQHRRGVVIRAARRWEGAREALAAAEKMPRLVEDGWHRARLDVVADVQSDARLAELALATAMLRYVTPDPCPYTHCDPVGRHRPVAVAIGGIVYALAGHPSSTEGEDPSEHHDPVVIRIERDRMVDLDAS